MTFWATRKKKKKKRQLFAKALAVKQPTFDLRWFLCAYLPTCFRWKAKRKNVAENSCFTAQRCSRDAPFTGEKKTVYRWAQSRQLCKLVIYRQQIPAFPLCSKRQNTLSSWHTHKCSILFLYPPFSNYFLVFLLCSLFLQPLSFVVVEPTSLSALLDVIYPFYKLSDSFFSFFSLVHANCVLIFAVIRKLSCSSSHSIIVALFFFLFPSEALFFLLVFFFCVCVFCSLYYLWRYLRRFFFFFFFFYFLPTLLQQRKTETQIWSS